MVLAVQQLERGRGQHGSMKQTSINSSTGAAHVWAIPTTSKVRYGLPKTCHHRLNSDISLKLRRAACRTDFGHRVRRSSSGSTTIAEAPAFLFGYPVKSLKLDLACYCAVCWNYTTCAFDFDEPRFMVRNHFWNNIRLITPSSWQNLWQEPLFRFGLIADVQLGPHSGPGLRVWDSATIPDCHTHIKLGWPCICRKGLYLRSPKWGSVSMSHFSWYWYLLSVIDQWLTHTFLMDSRHFMQISQTLWIPAVAPYG